MTKPVEFPPTTQLFDRRPTGFGFDDDPRRPILAWTGTLAKGFAVEPHSHPRAQLVMCYTGLIRLRVGEDAWFVPAKHGVWIPPCVMHQLGADRDVEIHNFFVHERFARRTSLPQAPTVVRASPLLRGIGRRLAPAGGAPPEGPEGRRLAWAAIDEMARLDRPDMRLPGGRDGRLLAAMADLLARPGNQAGLAVIAESAGTSERTLARLFRSETGLGFREWRARMRFVVALERLEAGETSTAIAEALGYSSPSAFTAAFRREFGAPPSAFRRRS